LLSDAFFISVFGAIFVNTIPCLLFPFSIIYYIVIKPNMIYYIVFKPNYKRNDPTATTDDGGDHTVTTVDDDEDEEQDSEKDSDSEQPELLVNDHPDPHYLRQQKQRLKVKQRQTQKRLQKQRKATVNLSDDDKTDKTTTTTSEAAEAEPVAEPVEAEAEAQSVKYTISNYVNGNLDIEMKFRDAVLGNDGPLHLFKDVSHEGMSTIIVTFLIHSRHSFTAVVTKINASSFSVSLSTPPFLSFSLYLHIRKHVLPI
jgi:hypothetical protein